MLEVKGIDVAYGELQVLWDVSFEIKEKELVAIVGSNGAGKTTLMKTISGLLHPIKGSITFLGNRIERSPPYKIVHLGISLVPEGRQLFPEMTVQENLELGAYQKRAREKIKDSIEWVYQLFPILKERRTQLAGTLSGGEQQMLAIGRALMSRPKLLMLDEPSLGLMPIFVKTTFKAVEKLKNEGVTILLVEQNVRQALELADRGYVFETGRFTLSDTGKNLLKDERVKKAYLGL
ncbi:MAG: ABC transporter ATP-binding protein [Candidatus Bathyarchaeia archaeon]